MSKLSRLRAVISAVAPEWAVALPRLNWIDTRHGSAFRGSKPERFESDRAARTHAPAANHQRTRRAFSLVRSR